MTTTNYGDNAYVPGVSHDSYIPDQLIAGNFMLETQPIIVTAGVLLRGTVLGRVGVQSVTSAPFTTNTGNATIGTISRSAGSKNGKYVITATDATHYSVVDPEGVTLPAAVAGTPYAQQGINFTITTGGTPMVAGDGFNLTSVDATGTYIQSVKTASDGSQNACAILVDNVDASAGPVTAGAYLTGEFNDRAVIYDASWTIATLRDALRAFSIFLKSSVSAADPT